MPQTTYEVRVSGIVTDDVLAEFGDVRISTTGVSTVLAGEVTDQAALLGLLARLRAQGLDVVEVRRVLSSDDVDAEADAEADAEPDADVEVAVDEGPTP